MDEKFRHTNPEIDIHAMGEMHEHPTWKEYKWVALILGLDHGRRGLGSDDTPFKESSLFAPVLLITVGGEVRDRRAVLHAPQVQLHKLFKALFTGPLMIAMSDARRPLFLFGKFAGKH